MSEDEYVFELGEYQAAPTGFEIIRVVGSFKRQIQGSSQMGTVYYVVARRAK